MAEAEQKIILKSLERVRQHLQLARIIERLPPAMAWGAGVAVFGVVGRLMVDRFPVAAIGVALIPLIGAGWLWRRPDVRNHCGGAILTAVLAIAAAVCLYFPQTAHLHAIQFALVPYMVFFVAAHRTIRRVDLKTAAIFVDQRLGLEERVSTALELFKQPPGSELEAAFRRPVIESAVEACNKVRTAKIKYWREDWRIVAVGLVPLVVMGISFLNPLPAMGAPANKPYLIVAEKGKKLETILKELEKESPPKTEIANQKLQPLKDTLTQLKQGNMSPFEADARLNQEKSDLQKEQDQLDAAEKVQKALDNIKGMEEMAKATDEVKTADAKGPDAEGGSNAAREHLQSAADKVAGKMSDGSTDKNQLAKDLQSAADKAQGDPQLQQSLQSAANDAKKGDAGQLSKDLAAAGQRAGQQGAQQQLTGQALKDAMSAIDRANNNGLSSSEARAQQNQNGQQNGGQNQQANSGENGQQKSGLDNGAPPGEQGSQQNGQNGGQQGGNGQQQGQGGGAQQANSSSGSGGSEQTTSGGSTNLHNVGGPGSHSGGPINGTKDFVRIYDPKAITSQGKTEKVSGQINALAPAAGTADVFGQADQTDSTIQTYESQLPSARKRALDDLQTQDIPPQYRDFVRNYYEK